MNKINLFTRKRQSSTSVIRAARFRLYFNYAGIVLFLIFLFLVYQYVLTIKTNQQLTSQKQRYLTYLIQDKETEANMRYFKSKQLQLAQFMKEDAHFLPYYKVLRDSLVNIENARLDNITIDQNRATTFVVKFDTNEDMLNFLKYVESDTFLKNFITLSMQSFSLTNTGTAQRSYELQLKGVFKEVKNTELGL